MSEAFESIQQGLLESIEFAKGQTKGGATVHKFDPVDVKAIRTRVDMSQSEFASTLG